MIIPRTDTTFYLKSIKSSIGLKRWYSLSFTPSQYTLEGNASGTPRYEEVLLRSLGLTPPWRQLRRELTQLRPNLPILFAMSIAGLLGEWDPVDISLVSECQKLAIVTHHLVCSCHRLWPSPVRQSSFHTPREFGTMP